MGSLLFNETIKDLFFLSIDFSLSFSDKFELIIQCRPPGDVYFQHEGQIIHSAIRPTRCFSSPAPPRSAYALLPLPSAFLGRAGRAARQENGQAHVSPWRLPHCSLRDSCPRVTSGVVLSAKRSLIYSKVSDGGGLSLLSLRANVT